MAPWPVTFSLPHGFTVSGYTSWALRWTRHLLVRERSVRWVVHEPYEGYAPLPSSAFPVATNFTVIPSRSMHSAEHWSDWMRAYRATLPCILLPALRVESFAVAAALSTVHPEALRVIGWNHSDNTYEYACLSRYEPIVHDYVVNSEACRRNLARVIPRRADDISYLPHAVSLPPPIDRAPAAGRPLRIAYGGRMDHAVKRVLDFVRLADRLDERGITYELRLVGDGPQREQLRRAVDRTTSIRLEPPRAPDEMMELWQWADVAMLMSEHEGLSMGMLEAMSAGSIPIVTAVPSGAADVIRNGENGWTFPIGDIDRASDHIAALASDDTLRRRLSQAARRTIETTYSWKDRAEELERLLNKAGSRSPRSWPPNLAPLARNSGYEAGVTSNGPSELTVPRDAAARMSQLLGRLDREQSGPIVIYGAGRHTQALADVWAASPVEIVGIVDDDPSHHEKTLWGWPIRAPEEAALLGANAVVISSWLHEKAIWEKRAIFEQGGLSIWRLYGGDTALESDFDLEFSPSDSPAGVIA